MSKVKRKKRRQAALADETSNIRRGSILNGSLHIGDTVYCRLSCPESQDSNKIVPIKGEVVFIHSRGRFHVVAFLFGKYTFRESFFGI